jgi:hypothetical protein
MIGLCLAFSATVALGEPLTTLFQHISTLIFGAKAWQGCVIDDGKRLTVATYKGDSNNAFGVSVGATIEIMKTNAPTVDDFRGPFTCQNASAGVGSVSFCIGEDGIWSASAGVGPGKGIPSASLLEGNTALSEPVWHSDLGPTVTIGEVLTELALLAVGETACEVIQLC